VQRERAGERVCERKIIVGKEKEGGRQGVRREGRREGGRGRELAAMEGVSSLTAASASFLVMATRSGTDSDSGTQSASGASAPATRTLSRRRPTKRLQQL
jgi:hypothetical protein